jgi:hypothetical protein
MPAPDVAIRAKRKLTNRLIAAHDAARLRPHLTDDMIQGAEAVIAAFADQFSDARFITYLRTTTSVEIAGDGQRAAELGRWTGQWKDHPEMSGTYLAAWRCDHGQWRLERELYITLEG